MHSRRIQAIQLKAFHLEDPDPMGFLLAQKCQLLAPDHCHRSQDAPIGFVRVGPLTYLCSEQQFDMSVSSCQAWLYEMSRREYLRQRDAGHGYEHSTVKVDH